MSISTGTRLGQYEVIAPLGAGGMGACGPASERMRVEPEWSPGSSDPGSKDPGLHATDLAHAGGTSCQ